MHTLILTELNVELDCLYIVDETVKGSLPNEVEGNALKIIIDLKSMRLIYMYYTNVDNLLISMYPCTI